MSLNMLDTFSSLSKPIWSFHFGLDRDYPSSHVQGKSVFPLASRSAELDRLGGQSIVFIRSNQNNIHIHYRTTPKTPVEAAMIFWRQ